MPDLTVGNISFEVVPNGGNSFWLLWLSVCNKLGKFFFKQLVFTLEAWNKTEDLFENLPKCETPVNGGGATQLF